MLSPRTWVSHRNPGSDILLETVSRSEPYIRLQSTMWSSRGSREAIMKNLWAWALCDKAVASEEPASGRKVM